MITVRLAQAAEISACGEFYARVLNASFTWLKASRPALAEDFIAAAREEEVYLARDGEALVGVAGFFRPDSFIHNLFVDPQGRGIGKRMLDHLAGVADGPLSLKCQIPNLKARAFYRREGFRVVGRGIDPGAEVGWVRLSRRSSNRPL